MWSFDFGAGPAEQGYTKVGADTGYDPERAYGFLEGGRVGARDGGGADRLRDDFCVPLGAIFQLDVPEGDYTVSILMGDRLAPTSTTVKSGKGPLLLKDVQTRPGQWEWKSFTIRVKEGPLQLHISGSAPRLNAMEVKPAGQSIRVFLAGDSTVTDEPLDSYPYAGWGQALPLFFKAGAAVVNHAKSGRSSKSFLHEGRLDAIFADIRPGDALLVQFGHNDEKKDAERATEPFTTYQEYLKKYIDGARERGALPVLITPVHRRFFEPDGTVRDTHGDYIRAVKELAAAENVPLLDLAEASKELFERLGEQRTKDVFMWAIPGEYAGFPNGVEDNTHFQEQGAVMLARLVAERIRNAGIDELMIYLAPLS